VNIVEAVSSGNGGVNIVEAVGVVVKDERVLSDPTSSGIVNVTVSTSLSLRSPHLRLGMMVVQRKGD
jgi:hypothetical protein